MREGGMSSWMTRLAGWQMPAWGFPVLLLFVCIASYGLLIPTLGFYWDDMPISWIWENYGSAGLERYFSTNRPFWGWLYQLTLPVLGNQHPVSWHIFSLIWRWLSAVALWKLLSLTWRQQQHLAAWAALLSLVFPAFRQQSVGLLYSHFFIVFTLFLFSQVLTLLAMRHASGGIPSVGSWSLTLAALVCSLYNLLALEYFFMLELVRGLLIWVNLRTQVDSLRRRLLRTLWIWLPYLALFIGVVIWRIFFFSYQTQNYSMVFLHRLGSEPIPALISLVQNILNSLWIAGPRGWLDVFQFQPLFASGKLLVSLFGFLVILVGALLVYLLGYTRSGDDPRQHNRASLEMIGVGLMACLLGGWAIWLVEVQPTPNFPRDRFTLPFLFGISLLGAGLTGLLTRNIRRQSILLGILVALAVGYQFRITNDYRLEWEATRRFFWQLAWRVPDLEPGTLILSNLLPLWRHTDNSLTAPINRMYGGEDVPESLPYLLYFPERRLGQSLVSLQPGTPVKVDYLAATFSGSTSQVIVFVYAPPGCLRILDPALDADNTFLHQTVRQAAKLSDTSLILPSEAPALPPAIFGAEPPHTWCYYFEQADLARQLQNWDAAAAYSDQALQLGDYPNDPSERIPFIEAYAHVGRWEQALDQTRLAVSISPSMEKILCHLWQRMESEIPPTDEQAHALVSVWTELNCSRE